MKKLLFLVFILSNTIGALENTYQLITTYQNGVKIEATINKNIYVLDLKQHQVSDAAYEILEDTTLYECLDNGKDEYYDFPVCHIYDVFRKCVGVIISHINQKKELSVDIFGIKESVQGKGIGTAAFNCYIDYYKGLLKNLTTTTDHAPKAVLLSPDYNESFYKKCGFKTRPDGYMEKNL